MKRSKKWANLALTTVLALAVLLAGCSSSPGNEAAPPSQPQSSPALVADREESEPPIDISKEVHLVGYVLGSEPKGMQEVVEELSRRMKNEINATVEVKKITFADLQSKYPLVLASGEQVDFIYTADWAYYTQQATKHAFLPITEEMLQKYMPLHYAATDKEAWTATLLDGQGYMIPTSTPDRKVFVAIIRGDLRKKYNLPEVKRMSDLDAYLEAIKQNEPEMIPINMGTQADIDHVYDNLAFEKYAYQGLTPFVGTDIDDPAGTILERYEGASLEAQRYAANTMKTWYDKGYINKNPYANKTQSYEGFCDGQSGVAFGNSIGIVSTLAKCEAKGIDVEIIPILSKNNTALQNSWLNNGVAIAANSKNPERTMMFLDRVMQDPEFNYLIYFGIEGKHYVITPDDKIGLPEGLTAESNPFPPDKSGFWFTNKDMFKPMADWSQNYIDLQSKIKDYLIPGNYSGFTFNDVNVKTEMANVAQVATQYENPLRIGAVSNVDDAIQTLQDKLKAAGNDKIKAEVLEQAAAFQAARQ